MLKVEREEVDGAMVLHPVGELTLVTIGEFAKHYDDLLEEGNALVVDMSGVEFIDSAGLSEMVRLFRRAQGNGVRIAFAGFRPVTRRLLEITHLDMVVPTFNTLEEALASVGQR